MFFKMPKLRMKSKRASKIARDYIHSLGKFGNHQYHGQLKSNSDVEKFLKINGLDWNNEVEECRKNGHAPSFFKNYFEPTGWTSTGQGISLSSGSNFVNGPGILYTNSYYNIWRTAQASFVRAVSESSYYDFLAACALGMAAIEAFMNHQAIEWNKTHSPKLEDTKAIPVKFEQKLSEWSKTMCGERFDLGGTCYQKFQQIRELRDDKIIHPKTVGVGITIEDFRDQLNLFREGVNLFLHDLHVLFSLAIPYKLVEAAYMPEVECFEEELPPLPSL